MKKFIILILLSILTLTSCRQRIHINTDIPMETTTTVVETTTAPETTAPIETTTAETTTVPETTTAPQTEAVVIKESPKVILQEETTTAYQPVAVIPQPVPVPVPEPIPIPEPEIAIMQEISTEKNTIETVEIIEDNSNNPDEGGGVVGVILDKYKNILNQGLGSMYECEKGYIYFETQTDYQTVNKKNDIHRMILSSGGYNVAEKLLDDALIIKDDWLIRKNPTLIIKCVDNTVLGDNITETGNARMVAESIMNRPDWIGISAVLNNNIVLISSQLLETEEGRFITELYIAKSMYPELFMSIDINEICNSIWINDVSGTYVYGVS